MWFCLLASHSFTNFFCCQTHAHSFIIFLLLLHSFTNFFCCQTHAHSFKYISFVVTLVYQFLLLTHSHSFTDFFCCQVHSHSFEKIFLLSQMSFINHINANHITHSFTDFFCCHSHSFEKNISFVSWVSQMSFFWKKHLYRSSGLFINRHCVFVMPVFCINT